MSREAMDLLDCFMTGLDSVVFEIATTIAREKGQVNNDGTVEIMKGDVKEAAESVFAAIREQAGKTIPLLAVEDIESMRECVLEKCRIKESDD
ncbi:MAG: hypothetical protein N2C14_15950 [Planctomycetales bacterium]